jgi:hypothetical protein
MKLKTPEELNLHKTGEIIGFFRRTQLVRRFDGLHEIKGGTRKDQTLIRNWCAVNAPEIIFADEMELFRFDPTGI